VSRLPALFLVVFVVLAMVAVGCGEGGPASGATVSVYVPARLCGEARAALRKKGWSAGDLKIRLACFPPVEKRGGVDLGAAGADARRATEDSTSVAYLEAPGPAARFSQSIVESADLAWIETDSATAAMHRILTALEGDSSSPRKAVLDEVG
jgi:hypothetical protein